MRFVAIVVLVIANCSLVPAAEKDSCLGGSPFVARTVAGYRIAISKYHDPKLPPQYEECRAVVREQRGRVIFSRHDYVFTILSAGTDVNGDGVPDIVLEGYGGGNHGTYTYFVVALGESPGLILSFENESAPAKFIRNAASGRVEVRTWDGEFFMFDGTATAFSPYPDVYLRIDGKELRDISPEHRADYDKEIRKLRLDLPAADLQRFRVIDENWRKAGEEEPGSTVLKIAVAYLYSGRRPQAHQTIKAMWPEFDQERIWKLLLQTRRSGILRYTVRKTEATDRSRATDFSQHRR